jgi:signal transduction histidine kinase
VAAGSRKLPGRPSREQSLSPEDPSGQRVRLRRPSHPHRARRSSQIPSDLDLIPEQTPPRSPAARRGFSLVAENPEADLLGVLGLLSPVASKQPGGSSTSPPGRKYPKVSHKDFPCRPTLMKEQIIGPLADRYRDYAEDIHCSGKHLLDLINDLLDMAKIEAGQLEYHEEPVCLREILDEAIRLTRLLESDARHMLDLDVLEPLPALLGDRRSLKQVLINLLGNAVKFTPEGGRISVAASMADGSLEIVICDTGIGIPEDRIADLCQPFKRIENVLSCRHQGSGMGLFITKTLVERHGGSLVIESGLGEGTTVRVRLPLEPSN